MPARLAGLKYRAETTIHVFLMEDFGIDADDDRAGHADKWLY
jgi:hypothetical protein